MVAAIASLDISPESIDTVDLILGEQEHLRRTARRLSRRCDADVDDLVQATLLRAYRARERFQPGTSVRAWTTTILRRVFYSDIVRGKRRRSNCDGDPTDVIDRVAAPESPFGEVGPTFDVVLEGIDDDLRRALLRLPPIYLAPFYLSIVEDLTCEEISRRLRIPQGTVMSRVFRARERLKRDLDPQTAYGNNSIHNRIERALQLLPKPTPETAQQRSRIAS